MARTAALPLIASLLVAAVVSDIPDTSAAGATTITIETGDPSQRHMAEWAVGRFEEAELVLPEVILGFPGKDLELCGGAQGRTYTDRVPMRIDMCWNDRFILLHELAHAWEAHNLADDRRQAFMAMRTDVTSWSGSDVPWHRQGVEHAANVIAWGLLENSYPISRTFPNDPASLHEAFTLLTDVEPLHDGGAPVPAPDQNRFGGRSNPPLERGR